VVEQGCLLSSYTGKTGIGGSNPPLSASSSQANYDRLDTFSSEQPLLPLGFKNAATAAARRNQQEQILARKAAGIKLADEVISGGTSLGDGVVTYLGDIKKTKKHKTHVAYKTALEYFLESCTKARVTDIVRSDLLQYSAFLRDTKNLQPRTVYNKFEAIMSFLKTNGIRGLVGKKRLAALC
jgi:hypothetical protein